MEESEGVTMKPDPAEKDELDEKVAEPLEDAREGTFPASSSALGNRSPDEIVRGTSDDTKDQTTAKIQRHMLLRARLAALDQQTNAILKQEDAAVKEPLPDDAK